MRYVTHSFADRDEMEEDDIVFANSFSSKKVKQEKKSISNKKSKPNEIHPNLNNSRIEDKGVNTSQYTVCQTMTNENIHQKYEKF